MVEPAKSLAFMYRYIWLPGIWLPGRSWRPQIALGLGHTGRCRLQRRNHRPTRRGPVPCNTAGVLLHGLLFVESQQAAARHTCQARWRTSLASRAGKLCLASTGSYGNLHVFLSSNALPSNCPGWKARSSLERHVRAHSCFFSCPHRNHLRLGIRGFMLPQ